MLTLYVSFGTFFAGIIIGFFAKRFHTRDAQYVSERSKLRTTFANILAEIASDPEEAFLYISRHIEKTDADINIVISYLSERKGRKLLDLYKEYRNQKDGKSFDPFTLQKIIRFH
ncbi:MAG: hypothetical protein K8S18_14195 [Desulfobacula sp.]|nr:hypothetical protein [Desulfobacula sp.]